VRRLFFALWPSEQVRKAVDQLNQTLKARELKTVKADNLHVTLVFLANVDAQTEQIIRQKANDISAQPFMLNFTQLAYWHKPRILCLLLVDALLEATVTKGNFRYYLNAFQPCLKHKTFKPLSSASR